MNWCERFGHKFRPRYNEEKTLKGLAEWMGSGLRLQAYAVDLIQMARELTNIKQTYVCDVCVRCGKVVSPKNAE